MTIQTFDPACAFATVRSPNLLVPWYLMASYAYYIDDDPILTDKQYDEICRQLDEKWDTVNHAHKHLIDRSALSAGTGYQIKQEEYPLKVRGAIDHLRSTETKETGRRKRR